MGERFRGSERRKFSHMTALIVDDFDDLRESYGLILSYMGIGTILEARNGLEGVGLYVKHIDKINLIITDLEMPLMDGAGFFLEILKLNKGRERKAKVILVTGNFGSQTVIQLLTLGVEIALKKPADMDLIQSSVKKLLESR